MTRQPKLPRSPRLTSAELAEERKLAAKVLADKRTVHASDDAKHARTKHETTPDGLKQYISVPDTRASEAKRVGQYITWDTWGPFKTRANNGKARYAHAADDAASGLVLLYGSQRKGKEVHKALDTELRVDLIG